MSEEKNVIRFARPLKCVLTTDERLQLGQQIAELGSDIDNLNNDLATVKAQYGAQIKEKTAQREKAQTLLIARSETRSVECIAKLHSPREGQKTIIRLDTDEVVETVAMTHAELQGSFRFDGADEDPNEGSEETNEPEADDEDDTQDEPEEDEGDPPEGEPGDEPEGDWPKPDTDGLYPFKIAEKREKKVGLSYARVFILRVADGYLWGWEAKAGSSQPQRAFLGANPPCENAETAIRFAIEDIAPFVKGQLDGAKPTDVKALTQVAAWLQDEYNAVTQEAVAAE